MLQLEMPALLLTRHLRRIETKSCGTIDDAVAHITIVQQGECEVGILVWAREQDSVTSGKEGANVEF
jgi:hypothetical protein